MAEILTSYHKRGIKEGLQKTLINQSRQKLGGISPETEKRIQEIESIPVLEKALEEIFNIESEETLLNTLNY